MSTPAAKPGYFILPWLPFSIRLILMVGLVFGGLFIQLFYAQLVPGFFMILAGSVFASRRSLSNKVTLGLKWDPKWQTVTGEEWDRTLKLERRGRKWQRDISNPASGPGMAMVILIVVLTFITFIITVDEDDELLLLFLADVFALFIPSLLFGRLTFWSPPGLNVKIKALRNVLKHLQADYGDELQLQPMLGLEKPEGHEQGASVPVDAKMMVKIAGAPDKFYGVQVQCSTNNVQGKRYPYLYAVLLFAPDYPVDPKKAPRPKGSNLDFEPSATNEAIIMVVRQHTTKTSGYHTNEHRQNDIVDSAVDLARRILAENS